MLSQFSYPLICTDKFEKTVAFYEDYFRFTPAFEMDHFVTLKREDWQDHYIAIIHKEHKIIPPSHQKTVSGMILNFPVKDVEKRYEQFYLEGLKIISKPNTALCGRKHFFVEDPNGILISVAEEVPLEDIFKDLEKIKEFCHVK